MYQFCLSAIRSGFRSRAVLLIVLLGIGLVGVAFLAASFSPRQPKTVTLDVGFSGVRFSLLLLAVFWVQEMVGREVERRTILYALAYPLARPAYVIGRFLGVASLLGVATLLLGGLLWLAVLLAGGGYDQTFLVSLGLPYWTTLVGFWLDSITVAAFALWIATLSTVQLLPVVLGIAFGVAGKSLGAVIDYFGRGADGDDKLIERFGPAIEVIRWILPDLSRLDWRVWSMYGTAPADALIVGGALLALGYTLLLLGMAVFMFSRREFF